MNDRLRERPTKRQPVKKLFLSKGQVGNDEDGSENGDEKLDLRDV